MSGVFKSSKPVLTFHVKQETSQWPVKVDLFWSEKVEFDENMLILKNAEIANYRVNADDDRRMSFDVLPNQQDPKNVSVEISVLADVVKGTTTQVFAREQKESFAFNLCNVCDKNANCTIGQQVRAARKETVAKCKCNAPYVGKSDGSFCVICPNCNKGSCVYDPYSVTKTGCDCAPGFGGPSCQDDVTALFPSNLEVTLETYGSVVLNWGLAKDAEEYQVDWLNVANPSDMHTKILPGSATTLSIQFLVEGGKYRFSVKGIKKTGLQNPLLSDDLFVDHELVPELTKINTKSGNSSTLGGDVVELVGKYFFFSKKDVDIRCCQPHY